MKNFINFFFSFDKLLKEKLIIPFFWLAIIVWGLSFFSTALDNIQLDPLAAFVSFINFFASILLALVTIRLLSEIAVAIFRINDNLSPDGGLSESADIDIIEETRRAAEAASQRARNFTQSASERTRTSFEGAKDSFDDLSDNMKQKAASARTSSKEKNEEVMGKGSNPKDSQDPTPTKILEPTAQPKSRKTSPSAKKTENAKTSGSKPASKKASPSKSTAPKKRGPKPGSKAPRDKDGNLLKKDGTPRKKPGPKTKK